VSEGGSDGGGKRGEGGGEVKTMKLDRILFQRVKKGRAGLAVGQKRRKEQQKQQEKKKKEDRKHSKSKGRGAARKMLLFYILAKSCFRLFLLFFHLIMLVLSFSKTRHDAHARRAGRDEIVDFANFGSFP